MSEGFYSLVVDYVKGRKLKLACEYCLVSEKVGRELISRAVCVTPVSYTHLTLPTTPYV